ncbi:MAG: ACT domain-containing protein [Dehalococcoidia bacterium]
MKSRFIISAVGPNTTGIVARIARELNSCGCNLEDSSMTVLGDHFSLMILVTGEGDHLFDDLESSCERLREKGDFSVALFPLGTPEEDIPGRLPSVPNYELRVKGVDRMGIVYRTSQLLASRNINIIDMKTSIDPSPEDGTPIFTMKTMISVPGDVDREMLRKDLESLAEDLHDVISLTRLS